MSIHAINTDADYDAALARLAAIMDAAPDSTESKEADALASLIETYEEKHFPIPPISFVAATWDQLDLEDFSDLENAPIDAPTKALLDTAQSDYDANPKAGAPFDEVIARLRKPRP